jgi:hypothetical protein
MPKGEIIGMFTGILCLSLMARTTTMMENMKAMMIALEIILYKLRRNNTEFHVEGKCVPGLKLNSLPNLRRDNILRNANETPTHQDSQKDQRSRPLTFRNSKMEEIESTQRRSDSRHQIRV